MRWDPFTWRDFWAWSWCQIWLGQFFNLESFLGPRSARAIAKAQPMPALHANGLSGVENESGNEDTSCAEVGFGQLAVGQEMNASGPAKRFDPVWVCDLITLDTVALLTWPRIVNKMVRSPPDELRIKSLLKEHNYPEAVLLTLRIWLAAGGDPFDLVNLFRSYGLSALATQYGEYLGIDVGPFQTPESQSNETNLTQEAPGEQAVELPTRFEADLMITPHPEPEVAQNEHRQGYENPRTNEVQDLQLQPKQISPVEVLLGKRDVGPEEVENIPNTLPPPVVQSMARSYTKRANDRVAIANSKARYSDYMCTVSLQFDIVTVNQLQMAPCGHAFHPSCVTKTTKGSSSVCHFCGGMLRVDRMSLERRGITLVNAFKILLLGDPGVGKSELYKRIYEVGSEGRGWAGNNIRYRCPLAVAGQAISLGIIDISGQKELNLLMPSSIRDADGIIIVYDTMHTETLKHVRDWDDVATRHAPKAVKIMVGIKRERYLCNEGRACPMRPCYPVSEAEEEEIADQLRIKRVRLPSFTTKNVETIFHTLVELILNKGDVEIADHDNERFFDVPLMWGSTSEPEAPSKRKKRSLFSGLRDLLR